ncbi:MAG TPA: flavin reductase family protein [bacterium]
MHRAIDPAILYFGTPVVVISTVNPDGSANLAPMSSAWWLRNNCLLGLDPTSRTAQNLLRTGECVLNLPNGDQAELVDRLALTTGTPVVPPHKVARGYRYEADKFGISGLTPLASTRVAAPRVKEFPVHMEAELEQSWAMAPKGQPQMAAASPLAFHMRIVQVHVEENLVMAGHGNRVDPDQWRPLIMSFQQFYKLGPRAGASTLASVPEEMYRRRGPMPAAAVESPTR